MCGEAAAAADGQIWIRRPSETGPPGVSHVVSEYEFWEMMGVKNKQQNVLLTYGISEYGLFISWVYIADVRKRTPRPVIFSLLEDWQTTSEAA